MIYSFSGNFYGFQHTFFHQQRYARSCAFNGCIFNFNRKHTARTKYAQIQNDFRRIHLRFFSICNANARLDLRSHNFKHIFSFSKIHSVDCINSSPLHRNKNDCWISQNKHWIQKSSKRKTYFFSINNSRNRNFHRRTFSRFYNRRLHTLFCFHRLADYRACYIHYLYDWTSAWKINRTKTFKSRHFRRNYFNRNRNRNIR